MPWSIFALASLCACLMHEDEALEPATPPDPSRAEPRAGPVPSRRPGSAFAPAPKGESSVEPDPDDPDDRDAPIAATQAGRPPTGASLPEDGQIAREALAHGEAGEPEKMRAAWLRLVRDHPLSPYVPLAYATFGDHYFDRGELDPAEKFYDKVLQFPESPLRAWALYKLAWCGLRRGDGTHALERFVQTLRAIDEGKSGSRHDAETLAAAARRDLVLAYAVVGKPEKAAPFFDRLGKGAAVDEVPPAKMLDLLGQRLTAAGQATEAAIVCKALQDRDPRSTCSW